MLLHASTIFLSAFLLFQVQPMIAKMILPWFGGSAAVWVTAMLFFQVVLVGGYLYAHWSIHSLKPRTQAAVHMGLLGLSVLFLPVAPALGWKPAGTDDPVPQILGLLLFSVGLPYFLLSTTSPLVQAWYSRLNRTALPYRLFALSNLASLAGLLAYPFVVEPNSTLAGQSWAWSGLYGLFIVLAGAAAFLNRRAGTAPSCEPAREKDPAFCSAPTAKDRLVWFLLAGAASTLLLAVTNHLTQNVASIPFLWVLPLSLYLLSFIVTFDLERLYHRRLFTWLLAAALGGMAYGLHNWNSHTRLKLVIPVFSAGLLVSCIYFHGELVRRKPAPAYLTSFYLMLSLGGAFGGILIGVAAPYLLDGYFDLALALSACAVLVLFLLDYGKDRLTLAAAWGAAAAIVIVSVIFISSYSDSARVMDRNFYGGLRVTEYERGTDNEHRILVHGTVDHGMQFTAPERAREHVTYYGPGSGVGLALRSLRASPLRVGVIGLGAGSLASYAEPGDLFRFYEINPLVERIAGTEFTYLPGARGKVEVVMGDGRLSMEQEPLQGYDLLAVDAFSGDAVPVHLLTRQSLELYFRHLKPGGILALHITNQHLDLAPVIETLRRDLGKHGVVVIGEKDEDAEIYSTRWALLSSEPITSPAILEAAEELPFRPELRAWTDDYSNLFQIVK